MAKITFKIDDSRAVAKLELLAKAAANPQPVYETVGRVLVNRIRLGFKLGVDPWGQPWKPIKWRAPRRGKGGRLTKVGKAQALANLAGSPGQPLVDTGILRSSISSRADRTGVTVGTNQMPRAAVHQFGATIVPVKAKRLRFIGPSGQAIFAKKVVIPARPFLPIRKGSDTVALPPGWALEVVRAIKAHLKTAATKKVA